MDKNVYRIPKINLKMLFKDQQSTKNSNSKLSKFNDKISINMSILILNCRNGTL